MPQAIHESTAFNSRNRKVAIHCVLFLTDNTLSKGALFLSVFTWRAFADIRKYAVKAALVFKATFEHYVNYFAVGL